MLLNKPSKTGSQFRPVAIVMRPFDLFVGLPQTHWHPRAFVEPLQSSAADDFAGIDYTVFLIAKVAGEISKQPSLERLADASPEL